ncbi:hypothetical protein A2U01_0061936, partial [Trifolium medium]|nr:hypothetical protein [Trifolium medium]
EPDYAETEKKWGNFIRAENGYLGGGAASNKWLRGGMNTVAEARNGASDPLANANSSINNSWKHSLFGRVKVTCDPTTKKMSFFKGQTDVGNSARTSETQWAPLIFNEQDKQDAESSSNV